MVYLLDTAKTSDRINHWLNYLWYVSGFKPGIVLGDIDVEDDVTFVRGTLNCDAAKLHTRIQMHFRQGRYVMPGVCLFVCLSICLSVSNFT